MAPPLLWGASSIPRRTAAARTIFRGAQEMECTLEGIVKPLEVLFVEDNSGDTLMVYEALEKSPTPVKFHLARDGEQALLMLRDRTFDPDLVVLDLGLPKLSGFDVLENCQLAGVP